VAHNIGIWLPSKHKAQLQVAGALHFAQQTPFLGAADVDLPCNGRCTDRLFA
jgi:hypothetical protein